MKGMRTEGRGRYDRMLRTDRFGAPAIRSAGPGGRRRRPIYGAVQTRPVTEPAVVRDVALVTVAGRRFSPAVAGLVKALGAYKWPE